MIFGKQYVDDFPPVREWDFQTGWRTTKKVRGVRSVIEGLIPDLQSSGATAISIDPEENSSYATLSYTLGHLDDGAPPEMQVLDVWTLAGNDLEKSLWEHPMVTEVTRFLPDDKLALLRSDVEAALENFTAPDKAPFASAAAFAGIFGVGAAAAAQRMVQFYREMLRGVEAFTVSQFVLQRNITVNPGTNLRPGLTNVGKVYTTASLTSHWNIPTTILFTLPAGEWLERTPSVEQTTNGKFNFRQEWWHAEAWSTFIYPRAAI